MTEKSFAEAPIVGGAGRSYRDLTGVRFGKLVVLGRDRRPPEKLKCGITRNGRRRSVQLHWWRLRCDCGTTCWSGVEQLRAGHKMSCGCLRVVPKPRTSAHIDAVIGRFTDPNRPVGQSISQLARELNITKGVAVGILHRAGLVGAKPKPSAETLAFPKTGECYYMFGDFGKPGFRWCGKRCKTGESYCPDHRQKIYTSPPPKKPATPDAPAATTVVVAEKVEADQPPAAESELAA